VKIYAALLLGFYDVVVVVVVVIVVFVFVVVVVLLLLACIKSCHFWFSLPQ